METVIVAFEHDRTAQRVKEIFDEQGITMTYPHLIVHMEK